MSALLRQGRVIDDQHRIRAADHLVRLARQFFLQRAGVPDAARNEMVQSIVAVRHQPGSHRLNALALAGTEQTAHIERAHLPPPFVAEPRQKRLKPLRDLVIPRPHRALHLIGARNIADP